MSPLDCGLIAVLYQPDGSTIKIVNQPLPLEYCAGVCEDYARRNLKIAFADLNAAWMNYAAPPTQSQRNYLEKNEAYRKGMSKADATLEIRKIIASKNKQRRLSTNEPITQMQKYFLVGREIHTANMTKWQAIHAISKIKQNERAYVVNLNKRNQSPIGF